MTGPFSSLLVYLAVWLAPLVAVAVHAAYHHHLAAARALMSTWAAMALTTVAVILT